MIELVVRRDHRLTRAVLLLGQDLLGDLLELDVDQAVVVMVGSGCATRIGMPIIERGIRP
ncbi:MAG: hypothetical protein E6J90_32000 [Deltaproteobacteria bacterium]|nr:MAG: hypothetical protein E6J91_26270 [Deltaproteobacteria bacterium]TMQ12278.1 MAG: hypothetical protein E6J90_32000 [Deltaproteobacteria bacterium]